MSDEAFTFRDGERQIRFGRGMLGVAREALREVGFADYSLLTTERALGDDPSGLAAHAAVVAHVPSGSVPDVASAVRGAVAGRDLVALGGGRVVDAAKAIAAADGGRVVAIPTTLAGSSFTPFHRMPAGVEGYGTKRPVLALCDPDLMASAPMPGLAATAMNALAHAIESTYAPGANPVAEGAALRAVSSTQAAFASDPPERDHLALAAVLAGYAVGVAGLCVHHAVCQTIVRMAATPHAQTNAVVLPHSVAFMASRAPREIGTLAARLGDREEPRLAAPAVAAMAHRAGATTLAELGLDPAMVPEIGEAAAGHPGAAATPGEVTRDDLEVLLYAAAGD